MYPPFIRLKITQLTPEQTENTHTHTPRSSQTSPWYLTATPSDTLRLSS